MKKNKSYYYEKLKELSQDDRIEANKIIESLIGKGYDEKVAIKIAKMKIKNFINNKCY